MDGEIPGGGDIAHHLKNVEQEKLALQSMLARAADELENLAHADCAEDAKVAAEKTAKRIRRASTL